LQYPIPKGEIPRQYWAIRRWHPENSLLADMEGKRRPDSEIEPGPVISFSWVLRGVPLPGGLRCVLKSSVSGFDWTYPVIHQIMSLARELIITTKEIISRPISGP